MTEKTSEFLFDAVLALALPALAARTLRGQPTRQAVVLFIAFGLLASIAWARLDAPDIAMVEAAVGAGLTGVLLMSTLGWVEDTAPRRRRRTHPGSVLLPLVPAVALGLAVLALFEPRPTLRRDVLEHLGESGASYPITAVLLDFRGYDTLLEVIVLATIAIAVRSLFPGSRASSHEAELAGPLLVPLVHGLVPLFVLTAGYLVWKGSHGPGGAFQAGALLAGGGVLWMLARPAWPPSGLARLLPGALMVGPGVFVLLGGVLLVAGYRLLEYPRGAAKNLVVAVESLLSLSIAVALVMFFPRPLASESGDAPPGTKR